MTWTWELASQITAAGASLISGVLWLWSASIRYPLGVSYWDSAPKHILDLMRRQARLNRFAALLAGVAGVAASVAIYCDIYKL